MLLWTWSLAQTALSQGANQEGKQVCVLYELGNKMQLDTWTHYEPLNGITRTLGGNAFEEFTAFSLKLVRHSFSK